MDNRYVESILMDEISEKESYMSTDEIAMALVKLYAEYMHTNCNHNEDYAEAIAIAIRMLTD